VGTSTDKGKTMDFPLRKEDLPIFHLHCIGVKENKIGWP
jgi:hypothetical protein